MDERQGTESSWIPNTPVKPGQAEKEWIYKEKQEIGSSSYWLNGGGNSQTAQADIGNCSQLGNSISFQQGIQSNNVVDFSNPNQSIHVRSDLSGVAGAANPFCSVRSPQFYFDLWNRGLMHLIDDAAAAAAVAQTALHAECSSCTSASFYHVQCASSQAASSHSSSEYKGLFHESGPQGQTKGADLSAGILYHPVPGTPNPKETANKVKGSDKQNFWVGEAAQKNGDNALHKIPIDSRELQKESQSEIVIDISCSSASSALLENHEPDMGSNQNIDLKTPQQKPRRKKHRPKVIIEDQLKPKPRSTKPACLEKISSAKRKYVRRNKGSTQGDTPTEGRTQSDPGSEAMPRPKRNYTRRKRVNEPATAPPEEGVSGTTSPKKEQATRRSCRRSLKFDSESERSSCQHLSDFGSKSTSQISIAESPLTSTMKLGEGVAVTVERTEIGLGNDFAQSMEKEFEDYLSNRGLKTIVPSTPVKLDHLDNKSVAGSPNECSVGRCQILFSDKTHAKVASTPNYRTQNDCCAMKTPSTSKRSSISTDERYGMGRKRRRLSSAGVSGSCRISSVAAQCKSLQDLSKMPQSNECRREFSSLHSPDVCKKKMTDQMHKSTISSTLPTVAAMDCYIQNNASPYVDHHRQALRIPFGFGMTQFHSSADSGLCRTSTAHDAQLEHTHCEGPPPSVDAIVEQFNRLDVAAESNMLVSQEKNALIAYHCEYPGQKALVVYHSDQTMVPFDASSNCTRKRRPRPKVNLDDETTRVWNLLLENINSEGIDGTDEEKRKWWQEERKVFRGRVNSFIAKMRLVQGDRRFRPWKGSVVDSVIGVFLTQNVSDHLSSSAFISMAARFPLKPTSEHASSCEEIGQKNDMLHSEEDTSGEVSEALQAMKNGNKNDKNNQDFIKNSSEDTESIGTLKSPPSDSSECGRSTFTEVKTSEFDTLCDEILMFDGDQRALDGILSSQNSVVSSQNSIDSIGRTANKEELCSHSFMEEESTSECCCFTSFLELLQMQEQRVHYPGNRKGSPVVETRTKSDVTESNLEGDADHRDFAQSPNSSFSESFKEHEHFATEQSGLSEESAAGTSSQTSTDIFFEQKMFCNENHHSGDYSRRNGDQQTELVSKVQKHASICSEGILDAWGRTSIKDEITNPQRKAVNIDASNYKNLVETVSGVSHGTRKPKGGETAKGKQTEVDWDSLRQQAQAKGKREGTANTMDSVDWEAVRCAEVGEIAQTIKERGMNNRLAERIKDFLNRLVRDHGSIDLEWLRDVPPDKAKDYLLSVRGLGLKSVECVRLLTLHHLAFPVDTNVGRIAVRLGWVPLQPLPESLQLHLLELYPVLESIQKYLWPRLCKLDQKKLYELHYQMITFGKVFCTKSKPNCNSCPMRGECRHFASAYASARLALPAPEDKSIVAVTKNRTAYGSHAQKLDQSQPPRPESTGKLEAACLLTFSQPVIKVSTTPKPIIEEPKTPEPEPIIEEPQTPESEKEMEPETTKFPIDIEDYMGKDDEIPTIDLNIEALNQNLQNIIQNISALQDSEQSKALVVLTPEAAAIPMPKLKNINRLRTEHQVYVLPDSHQLLNGLEKREENDPCPYLLSIWAPGETINSIQPPERRCSSEESGRLCCDNTCFACSSIREATSQTVRGTLLIPCRTAMRGSFPLNGTYFQVNEVFADHSTSLNPIDVPREWLWNLRRRTVYFGTSIPTIFKGLEPTEIRHCFWKGFVCVRGFDRATRAPRPLIARLHFPASKMARNKGGKAESRLPKAASD